MAGTKENSAYSVFLITATKKYNLTECVEELKFTDQEKQFAKSVQISLANIMVNGEWLCNIPQVRDRIFIYAGDGEKSDEVWRGYIWTHGYKSALETRTIALKCYDNLIYCQESEESEYFTAGKDTKAIMTSLCNKWGIPLDYTYSTITHPKLPLRGKLSEIITSDILDAVKKKTGKKYVVLSIADRMTVREVGQNKTIYKILAGHNAISTESECTMDGMITKVVILGKADKNDRRPVEGTVSGKTDKYGTIQKLVNRDENTTLTDAKKEAGETINESGEPKWKYSIEAPDIPWIRKGDKICVSAGNQISYFICLGIERTITNKAKIMKIEAEAAK